MATPIYPQLVTLAKPGPTGTPIDPTDPTTPQSVQLSQGNVAVGDSNPVPVKGVGYKSTVTITRPSNTTAYTAGDVVGQADSGTPANAGTAILEFASIGPSAGHIVITGLLLEIDVNAVPAGMTTFRLHLYDAAPDAILDNAAFDLSSAGDRGKYLGWIDVRVPVDIGSTLIAIEDGLSIHRKLATASTSIFGVLQTIGAYTPSSGAVKKLTLRAVAV